MSYDTFLTTSYKGYYIQSKREIATGKDIITVSGFSNRTFVSHRAAKCFITKKIKAIDSTKFYL